MFLGVGLRIEAGVAAAQGLPVGTEFVPAVDLSQILAVHGKRRIDLLQRAIGSRTGLVRPLPELLLAGQQRSRRSPMSLDVLEHQAHLAMHGDPGSLQFSNRDALVEPLEERHRGDRNGDRGEQPEGEKFVGELSGEGIHDAVSLFIP